MTLEVGSLKDVKVLTVGSNQLEDEWGTDQDLSNCNKIFYLNVVP